MAMASIPEIAIPFTKRVPRIVPVKDDTMEPTIRRGDFLFVVPVDKFQYDSIYVLDNGGCHRTYRVTGLKDKILSLDNPRYSSCTISREQFNADVTGLVVGHLRVIDGRYFDGSL